MDISVHLNLYAIALEGLHKCFWGWEQKLSAYESGVNTKDLERVKKIAKEIEVIHQNQHQFFRALGIQSSFIRETMNRGNCIEIFNHISERKLDIANPENGIKVIEDILEGSPDIAAEYEFMEMLQRVKSNPTASIEYVDLVRAAVMIMLLKNYKDVVRGYDGFAEKLKLLFKRATGVFGEIKGMYPNEYTLDVNPDAVEKQMNEALQRYIEEHINPDTHKAYR